MSRRAIVRLDGEPVGRLTELPDGGSRFEYSDDWRRREGAEPISLTLPIDGGPWESRGLHPFFENLLPEGWLLELSTLKLKLSKDDAFRLLVALCRDCVGAVEIVPADD